MATSMVRKYSERRTEERHRTAIKNGKAYTDAQLQKMYLQDPAVPEQEVYESVKKNAYKFKCYVGCSPKKTTCSTTA